MDWPTLRARQFNLQLARRDISSEEAKAENFHDYIEETKRLGWEVEHFSATVGQREDRQGGRHIASAGGRRAALPQPNDQQQQATAEAREALQERRAQPMKVIDRGPAPKDHPAYKTGPVVGGRRIGRSSKTGVHASQMKRPKPVFTRIDAEMSDERIKWNLIDVLLKSGFRFEPKLMEFHRRGPYAQPKDEEA